MHLPLMLLATVGTCLGLLMVAATATNPAQLDNPGRLPTHQRQKRHWIWNQMHIEEEKNTSLPHHVGKVRLRPRAGEAQQEVGHSEGGGGIKVMVVGLRVRFWW